MSERRDYIGTEVFDQTAEAAWAGYRASGMPALLDGYHKTSVLCALNRVGLLGRLAKGITEFGALVDGLDRHFAAHLLAWMTTCGWLRSVTGGYELTTAGELLLQDTALAQLTFYAEAYGPVTSRIHELLLGIQQYGTDVARDGGALGRSCNALFDIYHIDVVLMAFRERGIKCSLDLGCGGGSFLIEAARRDHEFRGVGLDISADAIAEARLVAQSAGVGDRIRFEVADAFDASTWPPQCKEIDALFAIGVLHEHFRNGDDAVIRILDGFGELNECGVRSIVVGEPELYYDCLDNDSDLYLVHILTRQGFPRRMREWLALFERTNLTCTRVYYRRNAGPRFAFYDLSPTTEAT